MVNGRPAPPDAWLSRARDEPDRQRHPTRGCTGGLYVRTNQQGVHLTRKQGFARNFVLLACVLMRKPSRQIGTPYRYEKSSYSVQTDYLIPEATATPEKARKMRAGPSAHGKHLRSKAYRANAASCYHGLGEQCHVRVACGGSPWTYSA